MYHISTPTRTILLSDDFRPKPLKNPYGLELFIHHPGYTFDASKPMEDFWKVSEVTTGKGVSRAFKTQRDAKEDAFRRIETVGIEKTRRFIAESMPV